MLLMHAELLNHDRS